MTDSTTPQLEVRSVDPASLAADRNIRADLDLDDAFRASIRHLGVLSPIVAEPAADGGLLIRSGHRRAAAAVLEGLDTVPVLVLPAQASDQLRLAAQIAENTARRDLTTADLLAGHEQLATFGVPIAAAAQAIGMTEHDVTAARTVAAAPQARAAATERQLTLTQAAGLAEFDDDPEQLEQLLSTLDQEPESFDHHVQSLRDDRARARAVAAAAERFEADGYTVLPGFPDRTVARPLYALRSDADEQLTEAAHGECPGRAVTVRAGWTLDDDGAPVVTVTQFCTEPTRHGEPQQPGNRGAANTSDDTDQRAEAARQQRRVTIANNKAWRSAETVRRHHLKQWLATAATIKGPTARWIVAELAHSGLHRAREAGDFARELVGGDYGKAPKGPVWNQPPTTPPTRVNVTRAHTLVAGLVLADMELGTSTESWRHARPEDRTARYLSFLRDHTGYTLSDVERLAAPAAAAQARAAATSTTAALAR